MKFLRFSLVALLMSAVFFSCKKDNDSTGNAITAIEGKWVGKYSFGNSVPDIFFSFNIKGNGVIEELNSSGNSKGSGTWSLNGTSFSAHYQWKAPLNTIYSVTATYNAATGKLMGAWGYDNSPSDGGLWEMTKQ